jgi:hypothetical protein
MSKIKLENSVLDALDMDSLIPIIGTYHNYFPLFSGQEHYRLLRYLGQQIQGNIVEIGTHAGTSAIALAADNNYTVLTYDIVDEKLKDHSDQLNIIFRLTDYSTDSEYEDFILSSKMIFIDAPHNGSFERDCYSWLKKKGYKGLTIWDDIHLNADMKSFWADVDLPKEDITKYGHITGTGVIYFTKDIELIP